MSLGHIPVCAMPHAGGFHQGSWRREGAKGNDIWNPDLWRHIARTAEKGGLDAVFFADNLSLWPLPDHLKHRYAKPGGWDAVVVAALAATATERIGVIATAHTEFQQPYILARQIAALDHLSGGRIGWNIVTAGTPAEYANFGMETNLNKEELYAKATEFVELVKGLWDSWEDDAYLIDQEEGVFYDPDKLHTVDFHGKYVSSRGPLNVMRPVQGYPVLAQAGGSGPGKVLAGTVGELIFTPHSGESAVAYSKEVRDIAAGAGRDQSSVKILSQLTPIVAATDEEAEEKWRELQRLLHPEIARTWIEQWLREDLSQYPMDEPLPDTAKSDTAIAGYREAVLSFRMPDGRKPTIRELIENYKGPGTVVGSPSTIADYMEAEIASGACDGFVLLLHGLPEELEDFVELVVPELQKRGRFRTQYGEEKTLRERFGFARPENQFVAKQVEQVQV